MSEPKHFYRYSGSEASPFVNDRGSIPHDKFNLEALALNSMGIASSSFTIHVAPMGSKVLKDDGTTAGFSYFGHVFISVKNVYMSGKVDVTSVGFGPGAKYSTKEDNLSFNDIYRYPEASTLTVEGSSIVASNAVYSLTQKIKSYMDGKESPPEYNVATNNCIDFVKSVLADAGVRGIYLSHTPDNILNMLSDIASQYMTPLIVDLDGDGVYTVGGSSNVWFDFEGAGSKIKTGWSHPSDGFLVLDKNHDGFINSGEELFGENSRIHGDNLATDGFEALAYFDSNFDSVIDVEDSIWKELQVWQDRNTDGISQQDELVYLDALGITSISLSSNRLGTIDENSNIHHLASVIRWADGKETGIVDVLLNQSPSVAPSNVSTSMYDQTFIEQGGGLVGQSAVINYGFGG